MKHCFQMEATLFKGLFVAEFEEAYDIKKNYKLVKLFSDYYREIEFRDGSWHTVSEFRLDPKDVKKYLRKRKLCK